MFNGKKITVGVTGGIAAYKAAEIVSWLIGNQCEVQVVMTEAACRFIAPLTFSALSGQSVLTDIFSEDGIPHIDAARTDLFIVVPATANVIAKAANGIADDLLSSALLATKAPVIIAPAMHVDMYANAATKENIARLEKRGFFFIEPGEGRLACGTYGKGRLADTEIIKHHIMRTLLWDNILQGKKILITAGPTYEAIDPVRFIGNRSSGKMGYALAEAAGRAGAEVVLVSGPTVLSSPYGVKRIMVESAAEMYEAVWQYYDDAEIVIAAAAVADFVPTHRAERKLKKDMLPNAPEVLELAYTKDILSSLGEKKGSRILVGFAAETDNVLEYAKKKLREKHLDIIAANDVSRAGQGFDSDNNAVTLIDSQGKVTEYPLMSKKDMARIIIDYLHNYMK